MKPAYEQYTEELHRRFGYLATWLPNSKLSLGDVGILKRDRFERVTSLEQLEIPFTASSFGSPADYEYTSSDAVEIAFKADASAKVPQPVGEAEALLSVTFKRANAVVFIGKGCKTVQIENLDEVGRRVLAMHRTGTWSRGHVIVTELVRAESATILVSNSDSASIKLAVKGAAAFETMRLAEASGGLRLVSSSGIGTKIVAARNLSPLFRASGVRTRLLRGERFETKGGTTPRHRATADFVEVHYADV